MLTMKTLVTMLTSKKPSFDWSRVHNGGFLMQNKEDESLIVLALSISPDSDSTFRGVPLVNNSTMKQYSYKREQFVLFEGVIDVRLSNQ